MPATFPKLASSLCEIGRRFYARGWVLGTAGNLSAVWSREPLQLAMTASGVPKGELRSRDILQIDSHGSLVGRSPRKPSAETLLHIEIVRRRGAGAVLHTHSIWATILSELHAPAGGVGIDGYEMLKGLSGVTTHEHREWVPIINNDQDMPRLARGVGEVLDRSPTAHAFLLRRHGLYTWGKDIAEAERHVEILEFLFEAVGRTSTVATPEAHHGSAENS